MGRQRVDLQTAAEILGISSDAVRKRAKRGSLDHETGPDGKLYVWVDSGESDGRTPPPHDDERDQLIEFLRGELAAWQEEARRKDHIIAGLVERVPALEAPIESAPEAPEAPPTASDGAAGGHVPPGDSPAAEGHKAPRERQVPWWRRFFGYGE